MRGATEPIDLVCEGGPFGGETWTHPHVGAYLWVRQIRTLPLFRKAFVGVWSGSRAPFPARWLGFYAPLRGHFGTRRGLVWMPSERS